jgi:hypothetical protein
MVRPLDVDTQSAVRDRRGVLPVNFLVFTVKDLGDGSPVRIGFTDYGEDVVTNIIDAVTGLATSTSFFGDESPIAGMDPVPYKIGVEIDTTQLVLNSLHPAVVDMVRGHDCRNGQVQIHRGYLSLVSRLLVAPPRCRRLGQINGAPTTRPALGGQGNVTIKVVSASRELTRINPIKAGEAFYRKRSDDRWARYSGTAGEWPIFWGEIEAEGGA